MIQNGHKASFEIRQMGSTSGAALIIDHLGGEQFLASLGVRDFVIDEAHVGFTLVHDNPKKVHSVTITVEPHGGFKVLCYGRLVLGTFRAPVLAVENVAIPAVLQRFSESSPASTL